MIHNSDLTMLRAASFTFLVRSGATMGDIVEALRDLWGTYRENPVF